MCENTIRSFNLKNLQSSLTLKEEKVESCERAKATLTGELEERARQIEAKERDVEDGRRKIVSTRSFEIHN